MGQDNKAQVRSSRIKESNLTLAHKKTLDAKKVGLKKTYFNFSRAFQIIKLKPLWQFVQICMMDSLMQQKKPLMARFQLLLIDFMLLACTEKHYPH